MRVGSRTTLALILALAMGSLTDGGGIHASYRQRAFGLADVRTIHVVRIGSGEAGEATREALKEALRGVGFETAERAERADAVLRGIAVTKVVGGETVVVFRTAVLQSHAGETLWHAQLRSARSPGRQAGRVARSLRASVERAVWEAARRVP